MKALTLSHHVDISKMDGSGPLGSGIPFDQLQHESLNDLIDVDRNISPSNDETD
jgi:hypothetical protein